MEKSRAIEEVLAAGRELVARGLVARTWGNISCRIDDKSFAITPSGIDYARLTPETIVQVDMESLAHEGPVKPSSEKGIHAAAYRLDPDTQFVIHTHQTCASCLGIAGFHTLKLTAEEKEALGGDLLLAPYGLPGSKSLRKKVEEKLKGSRVILMERHGILITGSSRGEAFDRSVVVEDICCRAMKGLSFSHDAPESVSSKDQKSCLTFKNQPQEEIERIHQALHQACPDLRFILQRPLPSVPSWKNPDVACPPGRFCPACGKRHPPGIKPGPAGPGQGGQGAKRGPGRRHWRLLPGR